jgi:hypothetical protein
MFYDLFMIRGSSRFLFWLIAYVILLLNHVCFIPYAYSRANARPLSPMRAAAGYCAAIMVGAAPVLVPDAPLAVPVTLPVALPVTLPVILLASFPEPLVVVCAVALAILVATASTEAAVTVNVSFHAVQVYVAPLTGAVRMPLISLHVPVAECSGVGFA